MTGDGQEARTRAGPTDLAASAVFLVGVVGLAGYALGIRPGAPGLALGVPFVFTVTMALVIARRADSGVMVLLRSQGAGGVALRRMLPMALMLPTVVGLVRLQLEQIHLVDLSVGVWLMVAVIIVGFTIVSWEMSSALEARDAQRVQAEVALRDRSAELERSNAELVVAAAEKAAFFATATALLDAITEAMRKFLEDGDWRGAFSILLRGALDQTESEYGFIGVMTEGPRLRVLVHEGIVWDEVIGVDFYREAVRTYEEQGYLVFETFDNLFGHVVMAGETVMTNEPAAHPRSGGLPPGHPPMHSFLGVPIRSAGSVAGMVGVANGADGYTPDDRAKIEILVRHTGVLCDIYRRGEHAATMERSAERLREALEQIERSNDELQRFAYAVSHDLRAPLRAVRGFSELLARRYLGRLDSDADDFIGHVVVGVKRMEAYIDDILAYSRVGGGEPEAVDLNGIVDKVLGLLEGDPRWRGVKIEVGELPAVWATGPEMEAVFVNLIGNAVKFKTEPHPRVVVSAQDDGEWIVVRVADNGIGIEPQYREKVLELFQRLHSTGDYAGSGIGLSIVRKIAERYGGDVAIEDGLGGVGTTVRLRLRRRGAL